MKPISQNEIPEQYKKNFEEDLSVLLDATGSIMGIVGELGGSRLDVNNENFLVTIKRDKTPIEDKDKIEITAERLIKFLIKYLSGEVTLKEKAKMELIGRLRGLIFVDVNEIFQAVREKNMKINEILDAACELWNIPKEVMLGKDRTNPLAQQRIAMMALARKTTGMSLVSIGEFFGGRDHGVIIYSCKKVKNGMHKEYYNQLQQFIIKRGG
jgi:hypothetical protein